MDFKDQVKQLGDRIAKLRESIQTEEATKNAFIMPFIQSLGYDVFNPMEVVPEFISDIGTKKGEKIDYAIMKDGQPVILVECKHWNQNLNLHDGQLLRYFHVSKAKFGILTNGITYRFYTDLVEPNKMDEKPFLEFRIDEIKDVQVEKLKEFHKSYFDVESIVNTASELKYLGEIRTIIQREIQEPSDDFTRYFARLVYPSMVTQKVLDQFKDFVRKSYAQYINDLINERLTMAMNKPAVTEPVAGPSGTIGDDMHTDMKSTIITTQEELEAYYVVRAILRSSIPANRVTYRDAQSYFNVLLDDTNRKPLCRFVLKEGKRLIITFDAAKNETRHELTSLNDIYRHSDAILAMVAIYDSPKVILEPSVTVPSIAD